VMRTVIHPLAGACLLLFLVNARVCGAYNFNPARLARVQRRGIITTQRQRRLGKARLGGGIRDADQWLAPDEDEQLLTQQQTQNTQQQTLFRHRFVVSKDFCIRMPLDACSLLRSCTMHSHLSTCMELQLEAFRPMSKVQWSPDASRMLRLPNAGGSSLVSEALAFELLARAFGASLEMTELELRYRQGSQMTDFAINVFGGYPLGVSVTRAYKWHRRNAPYRRGSPKQLPAGLDRSEAQRLLIKKLSAINSSSRNVENYSWRKQLLIVFTFSHDDAALLEREYATLPLELRANTVLLVTRTNGVQWIW